MTNEQISYNKIMFFIDGCETLFDFKCCDLIIELYGKFFPEEEIKKEMLNKLKSERFKEMFNPKEIQA